ECIWTKMPPSCKAIAAMSTRDVSLADHQIAARKSFDVITDSINNAGELVTDGHGYWNGFLSPLIPIVDVHVRTADRRLQHPNQYLIAANFWNRNVLQPQPRLAFGLHNRLHHFLHGEKLGESGTQESRKVREEWLAGEDWVGQTRHHNQMLSDSLISASVLLKGRIKFCKRPVI